MFKNLLIIICGSILISISLNAFVVPNHLLNGGVIGLGVIFKYAFNFKIGLTVLCLSIPLYLIALVYYRSYFFHGIQGMVLCAFFIDLLEPLSSTPNSAPLYINALTAGFLLGTGIGLLLLVGSSTGGGDLLGLMIAQITSINVGIIILLMDLSIILLGSILIEEVTIFYSFIMIFMIGLTTYTITHFFKEKNDSYTS